MTAPKKEYDAIIIGTRIAGAILGSLLGEQGHKVLAIDRAEFPSDTLSTHFFRAPAFRAFDAIGVMDEVGQQAPKLRVNYNVIDGIIFPEPVDRPEDYPFFMNIRRITLDAILHRRLATAQGVEAVQDAVATGLIWDGKQLVGVKWKDDSGKHESRARVIVGADGARSFLARKVKAEFEHRDEITRTMYYAYFSGIEPNEGPAAEFHYNGNEIGYLMPCDANLSLLAISAPIDEFEHFKKDPAGHLMARLNEMSAMKTRLSAGKMESKVMGTGSIFTYKRVPYGPGWALVGDAGMAFDPWSGQGIDQSSSHAKILAGHLNQFFADELTWEAAMRDFHQKRNAFSKKAYRQTSTFSSDLRPMTQAALKKRGLAH
jgi:2-polyprenyl-6-methoxyphenol hydroxylase-like FAD-dependent oxidoreductase